MVQLCARAQRAGIGVPPHSECDVARAHEVHRVFGCVAAAVERSLLVVDVERQIRPVLKEDFKSTNSSEKTRYGGIDGKHSS